MLGSGESEHPGFPGLTNGEIIFEEFQPMSSKSINVTDRQTDGRTDGPTTTCDRKTALCTVVHRTVKQESCAIAKMTARCALY